MELKIRHFSPVKLVHFMLSKATTCGEGNHHSVDTILDDSYFGGVEATWSKRNAERREWQNAAPRRKDTFLRRLADAAYTEA